MLANPFTRWVSFIEYTNHASIDSAGHEPGTKDADYGAYKHCMSPTQTIGQKGNEEDAKDVADPIRGGKNTKEAS